MCLCLLRQVRPAVLLQTFEAAKYHWSETKVQVLLVVRRHCITQVDATSKQPLANYCYKDIEALIKVSRFEWTNLTTYDPVGSPEIAD